MTALLLPAGAIAEEALRWLLHHRTGLTAALTGCCAWTGHRIRRLFVSPGTRVQGRDTPKPRKAVAA